MEPAICPSGRPIEPTAICFLALSISSAMNSACPAGSRSASGERYCSPGFWGLLVARPGIGSTSSRVIAAALRSHPRAHRAGVEYRRNAPDDAAGAAWLRLPVIPRAARSVATGTRPGRSRPVSPLMALMGCCPARAYCIAATLTACLLRGGDPVGLPPPEPACWRRFSGWWICWHRRWRWRWCWSSLHVPAGPDRSTPLPRLSSIESPVTARWASFGGDAARHRAAGRPSTASPDATRGGLALVTQPVEVLATTLVRGRRSWPGLAAELARSRGRLVTILLKIRNRPVGYRLLPGGLGSRPVAAQVRPS